MRVLLTRAAEDAARTAEKLAAAGHEAVLAPVIDIVGTGADWPVGLFDALLATSAHAFAMLESGPTPEVLRLMPLHLVGERTADIETALEVAGQELRVVEIYDAHATSSLPVAAMAAIRAHTIEATLHYSRRSATLFGTLASAAGLDISGLRHVCLSEDVAAALRQRGLPFVDVAEAPNDAALLARLDQDA